MMGLLAAAARCVAPAPVLACCMCPMRCRPACLAPPLPPCSPSNREMCILLNEAYEVCCCACAALRRAALQCALAALVLATGELTALQGAGAAPLPQAAEACSGTPPPAAAGADGPAGAPAVQR